MKNIKKIIIVALLIPTTLITGGLIKYNIDLNGYKKQDTIENQKSENRSKVNTTEVHIIGTVHFETDSIKRHDLYNYIDNISPSIILYEGNSSTVKRIVKKTDYFAQLVNVFKNRDRVEKSVSLKYLEHNPNCVLLPYEWELRDKYHRKHKLRKKSKKLINSVIGLYNENLLTINQSTKIHRFLELNKALTKIGKNGTITDINNVNTDSIVKQRQYYIYTEIPEMTNERKELSEYLDFVPVHMSYWDKRNKAMVQNILKQIKLNPNKVIVVLNGFYHRYYLIDELKKHEAEYGFSIK